MRDLKLFKIPKAPAEDGNNVIRKASSRAKIETCILIAQSETNDEDADSQNTMQLQ